MRLAIVCPHAPGLAPSQRLKYEQYFDSWRAAGFEIDVFPFWERADWELLYRAGGFAEKSAALARGFARRAREEHQWLSADLVYVHLGMAPVGPSYFERRLIESSVPYVYDIDDLVHRPHQSRANPFMARLRNPARVADLIRGASEVVVCTEYLESWARSLNDRVTDISSTIDTARYTPRSHRDADPVVVGWSGSHSTSPYLRLLTDVLGDLAKQASIRVRVIGDPSVRIDGVDVEALPWREESEVEDLSAIDIGVYPLPHEEWVLGKSGLKALQYMGVGIPTVAERLGSNLRIITDGVNGFLASGHAEWLERLTTLVRDPELRARLGRAGRQTVVDRFSVEANRPRYLEVLHSALRGSR